MGVARVPGQPASRSSRSTDASLRRAVCARRHGGRGARRGVAINTDAPPAAGYVALTVGRPASAAGRRPSNSRRPRGGPDAAGRGAAGRHSVGTRRSRSFAVVPARGVYPPVGRPRRTTRCSLSRGCTTNVPRAGRSYAAPQPPSR
jgi:hypothetical protein